jgi:hypothetical protein
VNNPSVQIPFDVSRAIIREKPACEPLQITQLQPLAEALAKSVIAPDVPLMLVDHGGEQIGLGVLDVIYHHALQRETPADAWMLSFCVICNAGAIFSPVVDGKTYHFAERGLYNAMTMLSDSETGSLWNHLTGVCMYGPLQGRSLQRIGTPVQMTAQQAADLYPEMKLAISVLTPEIEKDTKADQEWGKNPEFSPRLEATLGAEDSRLPRLEMGLGLWTDSTHRYYRMADLKASNNVILDQIDGQSLVIYVDPKIAVPNAIFADAKSAEWQGDSLNLSDGQRIRGGGLLDGEGRLVRAKRPLQLFTRWYSFAVTFPNCEIYKPA